MDENPAGSSEIKAVSEVSKPKRKIGKWVFLGIGLIVLVGAVWLGLLIYSGFKSEAIVKPILVEYIQDIQAGKLDIVYNDLSSTEMKNAMSYASFQYAVGVMPCIYNGFQSLDLSGFDIQDTGNGTFYNYTGTVTYSNGDQGALTATLQKDNGEFKVYGLNINITPQRFKTLCVQGQSSSTAQ